MNNLLSKRSKRQGLFCFGISLMAIAVLSGCSKDTTKGIVSGKVTVDGKLSKSGAIAFIPADGMAPTAGAVIKDGEYRAEVPCGLAKVEIRADKIVGERKLYQTPDSPVQPIYDQALPAKFNSETVLEYDVKPGNNKKDWNLSTK